MTRNFIFAILALLNLFHNEIAHFCIDTQVVHRDEHVAKKKCI